MESRYVELAPANTEHLEKMGGKKDAPDGEVKTKIGRINTKVGQLTVRFSKVDGSGWSFSYSHLYRITFTDKAGLVLEFSDHVVTISGRNLGKTLDYLEEHKAKEVSETKRPEMEPDGAEVVESITVHLKGKA